MAQSGQLAHLFVQDQNDSQPGNPKRRILIFEQMHFSLQYSSSPTQRFQHGSLYPLSRDSRALKDLHSGKQAIMRRHLSAFHLADIQLSSPNIRGIYQPIMQSADGDLSILSKI